MSLVLTPKTGEPIHLIDKVTGVRMTVTPYQEEHTTEAGVTYSRWRLAFDAPPRILIVRDKPYKEGPAKRKPPEAA